MTDPISRLTPQSAPWRNVLLALLAATALSLGVTAHDLYAKGPSGCADWTCDSNVHCKQQACDLCAGDHRCAKIAGEP